MDGGDDMAALNFICSSLKEGANHTCCSKLLEHTRRRRLKKNQSVYLDCDILTVHAHEKGLTSKMSQHRAK